MKWLRLLTGVVVVCCTFVLSVAGLSQAADDELRVAVNATAPPFAFMENGVLVGLEVDLHAEVAKRMGKKYVLTNIPFAGLAPGLQSKKWDAAGNTWINKERLAMLDFSDPWIDAQLYIVTRKADNLTGPEMLKGKTVGAEAGTAEQRWLDANQEKYGPYTIRTYDRSIDILMDLMNKRLDAYLREKTRGLYQIKNYPTLGVAFPVGGIFVQGVAFRKDDKLRDEYNKVLNSMKQDGTLPMLYTKWLGVEPDPESSSAKVYTTPYQPE